MKVISKIEYGSTNYCLNIPTSDHDYKLIVTPNFDELYIKKDLNSSALPVPYTDHEHYSCMDIRTFADNLAKGNPNAIEMLFSTDIVHLTGDSNFAQLLIDWRVPYKNGYIASKWHYFTEAVGGIMYNSFKRYGVTLKTASRAIYFTRLVEYIAAHDFKIADDVLRAPEVWEFAREVRLEEVPFTTDINDYMEPYHDMVDSIEVPQVKFDSNKLFIEPAKQFVRMNMED